MAIEHVPSTIGDLHHETQLGFRSQSDKLDKLCISVDSIDSRISTLELGWAQFKGMMIAFGAVAALPPSAVAILLIVRGV